MRTSGVTLLFVLCLLILPSCHALPGLRNMGPPRHGGIVPEPTLSYDHCRTLDSGAEVKLWWSIEGDTIRMAMLAEAIGWLGVGFSSDGSMSSNDGKPTDLIVGWKATAGECGQGCMHDYYCLSTDKPFRDDALDPERCVGPEQHEDCPTAPLGTSDVTLLAAQDTGVYTLIEFSRPLVTGDRYDRDIVPGEVTHVLWALNLYSDGHYKDGHLFQKHHLRGSVALRLDQPSVCVADDGIVNAYVDPGGDFAMSWEFVSDRSEVRITMSGRTQGWVGLGFSTDPSMPGSDMYIGFIDDFGRPKVQDRWAASHDMPVLDAVDNVVVEDGRSSPGTGSIELVWRRPLLTGDDAQDVTLVQGQSLYLLWALGDEVPPIDSPVALFSKHYRAGSVKIDLFSGETTDDRRPMLAAHGGLMLVAFFLCMGVGQLVARFAKHALGAPWFPTHIVLAVLGMVCALIGVSLAAKAIGNAAHLRGAHEVLGLLVLCIMMIQPVLGLLADRLWHRMHRDAVQQAAIEQQAKQRPEQDKHRLGSWTLQESSSEDAQTTGSSGGGGGGGGGASGVADADDDDEEEDDDDVVVMKEEEDDMDSCDSDQVEQVDFGSQQPQPQPQHQLIHVDLSVDDLVVEDPYRLDPDDSMITANVTAAAGGGDGSWADSYMEQHDIAAQFDQDIVPMYIGPESSIIQQPRRQQQQQQQQPQQPQQQRQSRRQQQRHTSPTSSSNTTSSDPSDANSGDALTASKRTGSSSRKPRTSRLTVGDHAHVWVGRVVILAGVINCFLGMSRLETSPAAFWVAGVCVAVYAVIFVVGSWHKAVLKRRAELFMSTDSQVARDHRLQLWVLALACLVLLGLVVGATVLLAVPRTHEHPPVIEECPDCSVVEMRFESYPIPLDETSYTCQYYAFDMVPDLHVIRLEAVVEDPSVVHHMIWISLKEPITEPYFQCLDFPLGSWILWAWGVGNDPTIFPPQTGFRVGANSLNVHTALQIHYDNPQHVPGLTDSSGVRMVVTSTLREFDAGLLRVGVDLPYINIPPGLEEVTATGSCSQFTQRVTVFSYSFHMHNVGKWAHTLRYRNGTLLDENPDKPLWHDYTFDFDSQHFDAVDPPVVIEPGDVTVTTCSWNSLKRNFTTIGGEATGDEMCWLNLFYFPQTTAVRECDDRTWGKHNCTELER